MVMEINDQPVGCRETLDRLAYLLEGVVIDLSRAQHIVSVCTDNQAMQADDVQAVQQLDLATQTVQAVSDVLKQLAQRQELAAVGAMSVKDIYAGAKLTHVAQILQTGRNDYQKVNSGEVELF